MRRRVDGSGDISPGKPTKDIYRRMSRTRTLVGGRGPYEKGPSGHDIVLRHSFRRSTDSRGVTHLSLVQTTKARGRLPATTTLAHTCLDTPAQKPRELVHRSSPQRPGAQIDSETVWEGSPTGWNSRANAGAVATHCQGSEVGVGVSTGHKESSL